ncbi:MAG: hypothetical protein HPY64_01485 [Anaerolineae bacterium]|nr:hypothetical protein [Anaerolineae bacterium]
MSYLIVMRGNEPIIARRAELRIHAQLFSHRAATSIWAQPYDIPGCRAALRRLAEYSPQPLQ